MSPVVATESQRDDPAEPSDLPALGDLFDSDENDAHDNTARRMETDRRDLLFPSHCMSLHDEDLEESPRTNDEVVDTVRDS